MDCKFGRINLKLKERSTLQLSTLNDLPVFWDTYHLKEWSREAMLMLCDPDTTGHSELAQTWPARQN